MEGVFGGPRPAMWNTLLIVFAVAAALSAGLIAALRPAFARYAMARPNARPSPAVPPPPGGVRAAGGGGVAVVAATLIGAWLGATLTATGLSTIEWLALSVATILLALTGANDDIRGPGAGAALPVPIRAGVLL